MAATAPAPTPAPAPPLETARPRAAYTTLQALGLLLAALAPAFMLAAALIVGMSVAEEIGFFATAIVVPLVAAGLVWRFGLWAKIVGILAALAAGFMLFWVAFGLAYPASPGDFVPAVLLPLGVLLAVGAGVAGIVQHRRKHFQVGASRGERRIGIAALGLVALAVVVSAATMLATRSSADTAADVSVVMSDFAFDSDTYTVTAGETTTIVARNTDPFTHTFTIPELDIHQVVTPGSEQTIEVTADAGTYTLYCEPHSDMTQSEPEEAGMAARLVSE